MEQRIIDDLKDTCGLTFERIIPITGGLLNLKWKISTERGEFLVKQYSTRRFCSEQIERIEAALQRQILLKERGVPCPGLLQSGDRIIRRLDDTTAYMVMDFCEGKTENADTVTPEQMRSLGGACAVMHRAFSEIQAPHSVKNLPVSGGYTAKLLRENYYARRSECPLQAPAGYLDALSAIEPVIVQIGDDYFEQCPRGFAHEDFHSGNLLFHENGISAIVDFDRNCCSYVWHDIGRALLSFALEGDRMNAEKAGAFLEGYALHSALSRSDMAAALRLTWCIEIPWWIRPDFFRECDETPRRFRDEMLWLTKHWSELDQIADTF